MSSLTVGAGPNPTLPRWSLTVGEVVDRWLAGLRLARTRPDLRMGGGPVGRIRTVAIAELSGADIERA